MSLGRNENIARTDAAIANLPAKDAEAIAALNRAGASGYEAAYSVADTNNSAAAREYGDALKTESYPTQSKNDSAS